MPLHRSAQRPAKHHINEISSESKVAEHILLPVRFIIIITIHLLPLLYLQTSLILGATGCSARSSAYKIVARIAVGLTMLILRTA